MDRPRQTSFDYVVAAISPALIITLIGSLVFFLTAVFYGGEYEKRLLFILAMFVMATVLIARLAITEGGGYAAMFAIPLALVSGLAMMRFVEVRGLAGLSWAFNWSMLALIWWCAHKLTRNCTLIDESEDASGEGLLQSFGWDRSDEKADGRAAGAAADATPNRALEASTAAVVTAPANAGKKRRRKRGDRAEGEAPRDWEQVARDKAAVKKKRSRAPGVWVVFFSLAALPIFGIGQGFIDANDSSTRRFAFWMLCIYVLSGLGLLLTTSLLGLRRYLRQRMLQMPAEMTGAWLMIGAILIVGLLAAVWILPRPSPEYSVTDLKSPFGSPADLRSSKASVGDEPAPEEGSGGVSDQRSAVSGQQEGGGQKSEGSGQKSEGQQSGGQQAGGQQSGGQQSGGQQSGEQQAGGQKSEGSGQKSEGQQSSGQQSSENQSSGQKPGGQQAGGKQPNGNQSGEQQSSGQQSGQQPGQQPNQQPGQQPSQQQGQQQGQQPGQQGNQRPPSGSSSPGNAGEGSQENPRSSSWFRDGGSSESESSSERENQGSRQSSSRPSLSGAASSLWQVLMGLLKFVYYLVFAAIAAYFIWKYRRQILEGLRALIANLKALWRRLFDRNAKEEPAPTIEPIAERARPFAEFDDPFASGAAGRWSPDELVRYSFLALEAWARERGCGRRPEQTAYEFADSLGRAPTLGAQAGELSGSASGLAELYSRAAYVRGPLPPSAPEVMRNLWRQLKPA